MPKKTIYFNEEEMERIRSIAAERGMTETETIKYLLNQGILHQIRPIDELIIPIMIDTNVQARVAARMASRAMAYAFLSLPQKARESALNLKNEIEKSIIQRVRKDEEEMMSLLEQNIEKLREKLAEG